MARRWFRRRDPHEPWRRPPSERAVSGSADQRQDDPSASDDRTGPEDDRALWGRPDPSGDRIWRRPEEGPAEPGPSEVADTAVEAAPESLLYAGTAEAELLPREPILSAEGVVRTYPGRVGVTALRRVSIDVVPGEFLALMGPSGSGKSTLLGLLAGLDRPEEGRVTWRGRPILTLGPAETMSLRRRELGMVFQSFGLLPTLSAVENVELPLRIAGTRLDRARQSAEHWLTRLGLEDRLENRTFELSAGQQQRVAVARALVIEPAVVLADEPIAEVDTENADLILDALADVVRRGGAVVAATHNPEALAYATRAVLLRDGRVEATGTAEEVSARVTTD